MEKSRILIAEDDRLTRQILRKVLEDAGYEVVVVENGRDAVDQAKAIKPDLVVMDGLLPKLHGFLACKAIKDLESPPKVIMLTGVYTKPTYRWEVREEYCADELLKKPIENSVLLECIRRLLSSAPAETAGNEGAGSPAGGQKEG